MTNPTPTPVDGVMRSPGDMAPLAAPRQRTATEIAAEEARLRRQLAATEAERLEAERDEAVRREQAAERERQKAALAARARERLDKLMGVPLPKTLAGFAVLADALDDAVSEYKRDGTAMGLRPHEMDATLNAHAAMRVAPWLALFKQAGR